MVERSAPKSSLLDTSQIRDDFVPKSVYYDPDFAKLEAERLWPFVWQVAGREEELPEVGSYITYDIVDDSILVVRAKDGVIKAYHNVCPHRGMRLASECGTAKQFVCPFHGWRFNLLGENLKVIDKSDYGTRLDPDQIKLSEVQCETWAGFIFINMDLNARPLAEFLDPVPKYCDKFEMENLRFRWYKTAVMPANWKIVLGFFNEFYHVQQAHPQLLPFTSDYSHSGEYGRHGKVWYEANGALPFQRSPRLPPAPERPMREMLLEFAECFNVEMRSMLSERGYAATMRLREEVAEDAPADEVLRKWSEFQMEAARKAGVEWPSQLTPEYVEDSGLDWHVFPNLIYLHGFVDGLIAYRVRPNGHDPESCIMDLWSLDRYGPDEVPPLKREFYEDWRTGDWGRIYEQDFENIPGVQKGLKSRAFKGERTNPVQERLIPHFHRSLRRFLEDPHYDPFADTGA